MLAAAARGDPGRWPSRRCGTARCARAEPATGTLLHQIHPAAADVRLPLGVVLRQNGARLLHQRVGNRRLALRRRVEGARVEAGEQRLHPGQLLRLEDVLQQRLRHVEIPRHEGVVGCAEPSMPRRIGAPLGGVVGLPHAIDQPRQPQVVRHAPGHLGVSRADAASAEGRPMGIDDRPAVLAGAALHDRMQPLGRCVALARLGLAQEEIGKHGHAGVAVGANRAAVPEQRHRRIAGQDHTVGFRPRHVQEEVHRAIDRLQPVVEQIELCAGFLEAVHLAKPAAEPAQHGAVGQHRVGHQPREADVVAADGEEQEVDLARPFGVALPQHQAPLQLGDLLVHVVGLGQLVVARVPVPALSFRDCRNLRQPRRVRHPLVPLVAQEQTEGGLGAGAGHAHEGHRAVRVLDRQLQGSAQLMRVERAMARLVLPARILLDERPVADRLPVADAGRIAGKPRLLVCGLVVHGAGRRQLYRHVGIAVAGGEAVAHADDEEVADARHDLRNLPAADLHLDPRAVGVGDLQPHGGVAGQRHRLATPSAPPRRGQPRAVDRLRVRQVLQRRAHDMLLGVQVVAQLAARIAGAFCVPARLVEHGGAPSSLRMARRQQLFRRQYGGCTLLVGEAGPGCAMHLGVGGVQEEAEGILHLPDDLRLRPGGIACEGREDGYRADQPPDPASHRSPSSFRASSRFRGGQTRARQRSSTPASEEQCGPPRARRGGPPSPGLGHRT